MANIEFKELHSINEPIHTYTFICNECGLYGLRDVAESVYGDVWQSVFAQVKKKITEIGEAHICAIK